ncbi:MAG TPA: DUF2752 domain-containing protein [Candidatus Angelobacter sp.]|jgi:hypothetical protein|nr:DUF2752 domain-containing protein [Candidatus Angelobacter sp.]
MEENWHSDASGLMKLRIITGFAMAAILSGLAVVYRFSPAEYSFYPRCPIYLTTHWLCPGCGSTRALHALLHLDVPGAFHYNALFTLLFPWVSLWLGFICYRTLRYDQFPNLAIPRSATTCLIAAVVLFTVVRNTVFAF